MSRLDRARAGQLITVTQAGRQYRFQDVGKATSGRRHRLPARYFTTTTTGQPASRGPGQLHRQGGLQASTYAARAYHAADHPRRLR